jgi:hypothetical protein
MPNKKNPWTESAKSAKLVPHLRIEDVAWSEQQITTVVFLVFWTAVANVSSKQLFSCTHEAEWTPRPTTS